MSHSHAKSPSSRGAFFRGRIVAFPAITLLLALYIILAVHIDILPSAGMYDEQRLWQLAILVLLSMGLVISARARESWLSTYYQLPQISRIAFGLIFTLGIVSSLLAPLPHYALLEVSLFFLLFIITITLVTAITRLGSNADRVLLGVITLSAGIYLVAVLAGYVASVVGRISFDALSVRNLFPGFANIRFFGQFQSWTLPLIVLPAILLPVSTGWKNVLISIAMAWWMLALVSGSRGPWLAILAAVFVVCLICPKQSRLWLKLQAQAFLGGIVLYVLLFIAVPWILGLHASDSVTNTLERIGGLSTRLQLWAHSLDLIAANPWLGAGPMHFAYYHHPVAAHAHNTILQWASEWGVPSALALVSLAGWGLLVWIKHIRVSSRYDEMNQQTLKIALLASMTAAAAHSMVSGIIVMAHSQMLMVFIAAWVLAKYFDKTPAIVKHHSGKHFGLLITLAIGLVTLIVSALPEATNPDEYMLWSEGKIPPGQLSPRFWQQGYLYE